MAVRLTTEEILAIDAKTLGAETAGYLRLLQEILRPAEHSQVGQPS